MKILSVNAGSSSLKFQLYEMPEEQVLISGVFERIGIDNSFYTIKINGEKIKKEVELGDHKKAFEILVEELVKKMMFFEKKVAQKVAQYTKVYYLCRVKHKVIII